MKAKKNVETAPSDMPPVIIMHTYKVSVTKHERAGIISKLTPEQTVLISENDSDTCYFIIPSSDNEIFLAAVSAFINSLKKVSISELREKYLNSSNYTLSGNGNFISVLFSTS